MNPETPDLLAGGEALIPGANTLLAIALVLVFGVALGAAAKRLHLPSVTGQILAGVLLGPSALHLFDRQVVHGLSPLTHFALGLMAVTVGAHLNLRRLRNAGKRLFFLLLAEATLVPLVVFVGLYFLTGMAPSTAALLATIAVATAPATVVALVRETRAKGVFVKTLVAAVALNNMTCMLLFELTHAIVRIELGDHPPEGFVELLLGTSSPLLLAAALGTAAALAMDFVTRLAARPDQLATIGAATILLTAGIARELALSPLLACLFLGFVQSNRTPSRERLADKVFATFEPAILAVFFTLAGIELNFQEAGKAGFAALIYFVARGGGKIVAVQLSMRLANATEAVRRNLGLALLPQAGLAIGLVILLQEDPILQGFSSTLDLIVAVVITTVTANELLGPIFTRWSLARSGEVGMDRDRLIDFLQEENIVVGLEARNMEEAIEKLVDHLVATHRSAEDQREELLASVLERESDASTCLGGGLAVPHGTLENGPGMRGVVGLSSDGLPFETPDGKPVHCVVLLATPRGERDRHLEVLAMLARVIGSDPEVQEQLYHADSPAHAWEVLHGEESEGFNYFLEDEDGG
jgi:Kef-type K+ transport system membrane component KefB/mannitol/fructose-specific phosphotransferase system IIA component (Ntr-type)